MNALPDIMPQEPVQEPSIIEMAASGQNLADMIEPAKLAQIGQDAVKYHKLDRESMKEWLDQMQAGIDLAKLVAKEKTYPWPNAANIRYPLITTAALQFNARAYPAVVPADGSIVKGRTFGSDPAGQKAARAERVAGHMSWQLIAEIEEWEDETDRLLVQLPIVGTMVRKVWYDETLGRPRCKLIDPGRFIVNDKVKTLSDAPRKTEEFSLYPYELETKRRTSAYRDVEYVDGGEEDDQSPQDFIEQHCRLDLDGDGYDEPYIVIVHCESAKVARVVGDFRIEDVIGGEGGIVRIEASSYFVPYHFMPSMDGGFWGTGFGLLLGGVSETINSLVNMMLDAGHMASLGGGFIGSDFRIKGGSQRMRPGEWKRAAEKGAAIRDSIVPMTFPGADAVLYQLLGMLIEAGNDVAGIKDVLMGDNGGKAQTATTTMALIEQGMAQFTAIYKRVFRSLRHEFKLLGRINAATVDPEIYNAFHDEMGPDGQPVLYDPAQDYGYGDMDICPVADPRSVTKMQEAAKAQIVMELATQGMANPEVAARRVMESAAIPDVEELLPQPPDPEQMQMQQMMQAMQMQAAQFDLAQKRVDVEETMAKIEKLKAEAAEIMAGPELEARSQQLEAMKIMVEQRRDQMDALLAIRSGGMAQ